MIFYLAALQSLAARAGGGGEDGGRLALVLLPPRDLSAAHADDAVRAGERDHQLVQAGRPPVHPDQGRAGQRLEPAAVLHLPGGVQLLRHVLRLDADRGAAGAAGGPGGRCSSSWSRSGCTTGERRRPPRADAGDRRRLAARAAVARRRCCTPSGPRSTRRSTPRASQPARAAHAGQLSPGPGPTRRSRATSSIP